MAFLMPVSYQLSLAPMVVEDDIEEANTLKRQLKTRLETVF